MGSTFSEERWREIAKLFEKLVEKPAREQSRHLEAVRESDPDLAEQVEELLLADDRGFSIVDRSPLVARARLDETTEETGAARTGQRLGAYRLLEVLGRGGMGVVYRAERADQQFDKAVAIKLLPSGLESPEAERRFLLERQILARLEHPGIARLIDGGVTAEGTPYLVMELVHGEPIDRYCERNRLDPRKRVALVANVCDAMQYAHQCLVIHRDVKPSNILIDEAGTTKLLDFGVGKLLDGDGHETHFQPHTPGFAAPEQLANAQVSTATDTYSLGALLQRLLTEVPGRRSPERSPPGTADVGVHPLPADLERILAKATAADPRQRYPTAATLGEDLRRYLQGRPVTARTPTVGYRLRRFAGRHRIGVALATLAMATVALLVLATLRQADLARQEAQRSDRIADLLTGLFVDANPWAPSSGETTVSELLERGVLRVQTDLSDDPALQAELLSVLGRAFNGQGRPAQGIPLLEEAVEIHRALYGEADARTARAMGHLGYAFLSDDRLAEATPLIEESIAIVEQLPSLGDAERAERLFALGLVRGAEEDFAAQQAIFERIVRLLDQDGAEATSTLALALGQLSVALESQGRSRESLALQRRAVEVAEATLGPRHPFTANLRNNLGVRLSDAGDYAAAAVYYRRAAELLEERKDLPVSELVVPLSNLGRALLDQGDFEAARIPIERAAALAEAQLPGDDPRRLGAILNQATLRTELGSLAEAERSYRQVLGHFVSELGPDHQATARVRSLLGTNLQVASRSGEAEMELSEALATQRAADRPPRGLDETLVSLGRVRADGGKEEEAEVLFEEALRLRTERLPPDHWRIAEIEAELGALAAAKDHSSTLSAKRQRLRRTLPAGNHRLLRIGPPLDPGSSPREGTP